MKVVAILALFFFSGLASAGDINCKGTVSNVMDYPAKCNGNMAFKTSGSNGKWICPPSENGNSIILTAYATGKVIGVYIYDQEGSITCESMPHYVPARYILTN